MLGSLDRAAPFPAEFLSERLARPIRPEWVRNRLHFAQQVFGDLVVAETARSLPLPMEDEIADELAVLGLLDFCRAALARRTQRYGTSHHEVPLGSNRL